MYDGQAGGGLMGGYVRDLRCVNCDSRFPISPMHTGCPVCATDTFASGLTPYYDYQRLLRDSAGHHPLKGAGLGIWRYRALLPASGRHHEITLGEGGTPMVPLPRLAHELNAEQVWIKDEAHNPTHTFKDRNAAVTVSMARAFGAEAVVVSTSGNHGAAVAAYAARAGLRCVVLTYPGIPETTRTMIEAFGARLVVTDPEDRRALMADGIRNEGWYPASNFTDIPTSGAYGHEGYKTIAYEIAESLDEIPDLVSVPNAYGEGLFGIWKGFDELVQLNQARRVPQMVACEPAGGPLAAAVEGAGGPIVTVPRNPSAPRGIGGGSNSYISVAALRASGGRVAQATEAAIVSAQRDLLSEGFFVEPASAAALAGLRAMSAQGALKAGLRIVLVSTSAGLKNMEAYRRAENDTTEFARADDTFAAASQSAR